MLKAAGAGLAGGAALLLAACGGSHSSSSQATTTTTSGPVPNAVDAALLNHLLDLEHMGIAAYTAGIPLLSPAGRKDGRLFLTQELSHAGELGRAGQRRPAESPTRAGRRTTSVIRAPRRTF